MDSNHASSSIHPQSPLFVPIHCWRSSATFTITDTFQGMETCNKRYVFLIFLLHRTHTPSLSSNWILTEGSTAEPELDFGQPDTYSIDLCTGRCMERGLLNLQAVPENFHTDNHWRSAKGCRNTSGLSTRFWRFSLFVWLSFVLFYVGSSLGNSRGRLGTTHGPMQFRKRIRFLPSLIHPTTTTNTTKKPQNLDKTVIMPVPDWTMIHNIDEVAETIWVDWGCRLWKQFCSSCTSRHWFLSWIKCRDLYLFSIWARLQNPTVACNVICHTMTIHNQRERSTLHRGSPMSRNIHLPLKRRLRIQQS